MGKSVLFRGSGEFELPMGRVIAVQLHVFITFHSFGWLVGHI